MRRRLWRLLAGLYALVRPRRLDQELDEELHAYLDSAIEAHIRAGMARDEAVRAARAEIGSLEAVKDYTRDVGWEASAEGFWRDLRYAARTLRRSPAFSAVAVLTLALGIGANTAIFSAINAIMLRQLPVERPEKLISLATVYPDGVEPVVSYAAYRRIAADGARFVDAIAASTSRRDAITLDGLPEPVDYRWVSGNYFETLGIPGSVGRTLLRSDERVPPGEPVAVLSDAYWTRRFARDPAVVGRSFRLKGATFTIVGVAAPGFSGESPGERVDVWMPLTAQPGAPAWLWNGHSTTWLRVLARRRPGVTIAQARAGLTPVYERIRDDVAAGTDSAEFRASVLRSRLAVLEASRGASRLRDNLSGPLVVLMAIVGLVLLVACANVANLMLARSAARGRETAVCLAIGAGRLRLVRQYLCEALLLAAFGGAGGLWLATRGASVLEAMVSGALPVSIDVSPDLRVFAFAAIVSCATAFAFGLAPALRATRIDPIAALRGARGPVVGAQRRGLARALVVSQIVVSSVLLMGAGLFVRSLLKLEDIETGFDPDRVVLFRMTPPVDRQPVPIEVKRTLYRELLATAGSVPGVEAASASFSGVFSRETWGNLILVEGVVPPPGVRPRTFANVITPGYFTVMRIAMLRGRGFTEHDRETASKVAVVNETFARQFFGGVNAIGRRVGFCSSDPCGTPGAMMTVVGVAEDTKYADLREPKKPMLYVPFTQYEQNLGELQVRARGDPAAVAGTLHRQLAALDPRLAIVGMIEARQQVDASLVGERLVARLALTFGLLALALAAVGLYGLVAYVAGQRTGEIAIRMALGADRSQVRGLVLRDAVQLVGAGLLIGIPAALVLARLIASQLYEVTPNDPLVLLTSVATLGVAALVAAYLPARRASRRDPSAALRAE